MANTRQKIIKKIFDAQNKNGLWKLIPENHKYYPDCLHYVPNYKASLWSLLLLAELKHDKNDERIKIPLETIKNHFFDEKYGIYSLKKAHFPIPCLNGNMLYLDCCFNDGPDERSKRLLDFFCKYLRFDDGKYEESKNQFCSNTSCFGKHSCYWGIVKILKGISFIPRARRNDETELLKEKCINFVLKHRVCYSSHKPSKIMIKKMDLLTFPNFYKSDFLEILWILKREEITSSKLYSALELLKSKQKQSGEWELERTMHNMLSSIGQVNQTNQFITERANEVIEYYDYRS